MKTRTRLGNPAREAIFAGSYAVETEVDAASVVEARAFSEALAALERENRRVITFRREDKCSRFKELLWDWKTSVQFSSATDDLILHPAYQQIIGLGEEAVPLLLAELESGPEHLFHALGAITGENPVPEGHYGDLDAMTRDWLQWGQRRQLVS